MEILRSWQIIRSLLIVLVSLNVLTIGLVRPEWIAGVWSPLTLAVLWVAVSGWLCLLWCNYKSLPIMTSQFWQDRWIDILIPLGLTLMVVLSIEAGYLVLSDETNLIAVSKSIALNHTIENVTQGKWYYYQFHPLIQEIPKRPPLFSFLLAGFHIILGYSATHAFLFNAIVLFFLLLLVFNLFKDLLGHKDAISATLILLGQPIVVLCATCAGFDLFAVTSLLWSLYFLYRVLSQPTENNFQFMWLSSILLAYTRYEYILVSFIFHIILLAISYYWSKLNQFRHWLYSLTPILYTPLLWQQALSQGSYTEGSDHLFQVQNLLPHFLELMNAQVSLDQSPKLPYNVLGNWVGLLSLVIWLIWLAQHIKSPDRRRDLQRKSRLIFILIVGLSVTMILTVLYLSHYFGHYTHPASARFFLLLTIILALMPIWLRVFIDFRSTLLIFYATFIFFTGYSIAVKNDFFITLNEIRKDLYIREFLASISSRDFLLITSRPGQYTIYDYGAIDFNYANQHIDALENELSRNLYSQIFVVQNYEYATEEPIRVDDLDERLTLSPLAQGQLTAEEYIKISRVNP